MKQIILTGLIGLITVTGISQSPLRWEFTSKKLSDTVYEIHLLAYIESGWHIYSSKQPVDAIGLPTTVQFASNPFISLNKMKEEGKLEKVKNEVLETEDWRYKDLVDFIQVVKLKRNIKTEVSGSIEFMACTDHRCLPPETVSFRLRLE